MTERSENLASWFEKSFLELQYVSFRCENLIEKRTLRSCGPDMAPPPVKTSGLDSSGVAILGGCQLFSDIIRRFRESTFSSGWAKCKSNGSDASTVSILEIHKVEKLYHLPPSRPPALRPILPP